MSVDGIYFESDEPCLPGDEIVFVVHVPPTEATPPVQLHCRGRVVRIEAETAGCGIAATVDDFRLEH